MPRILKFELRHHQTHQGEYAWCIFCICSDREFMVGLGGTEENTNTIVMSLNIYLQAAYMHKDGADE